MIEVVQRVALDVALKLVRRSKRGRARASPRERLRRECDFWLRLLRKVRALPPQAARFGDGAARPRDYDFVRDGAPECVAALWRSKMSNGGRREAELSVVSERYESALSEYRRAAEARRADELVEALQEAARTSPRGGFMAKAFSILREVRPSACGNKARSGSSDKMCAIFRDGCGKDLDSLCTAADGFREELLKQGTALYESKPTCLSAVEDLIGRLQPVLARCSTEAAEGGDGVGVDGVGGGDGCIDGDGDGGDGGGGNEDEQAQAAAESLVERVMGEGRWRTVLSKVRSQLAVGADGFPAYLLKLASPEVQGVYLDGLKDVVRHLDVPEGWSTWPVILAPKPGKDRRVLRKRRDITLLQHGWSLLLKLLRPGYGERVEATRPWCQAGFEAHRTPPCQTLCLRAAIEQSMVLRRPLVIAFLDYAGFFNSVIRDVQRLCERRFDVPPRLSEVVFAVHEAARAYFETALGQVGPAPVKRGNGQGCPLGPDRSLLPLTLVARAVELLGGHGGWTFAAPEGCERAVSQVWCADDGSFMSDSVAGVQLVLESVWLTAVVLGLEIGWDRDASKTAWLAWRWQGNKLVVDEAASITLPLGVDGADVEMPRITDVYKHLGTELTGTVDHSAIRARVEARIRALVQLVGRLGGAQLEQVRDCLLTVVRGVLGYYGRATPMARAVCHGIDVEMRRVLAALGHRGRCGQVLQAYAPVKAGGLGLEPAACTAAAALCDELSRALAGRDGEPARLAIESQIALTCHRLGFEPTEACPTPLEWWPAHLVGHLSEEMIGEAWLLYRMRAGVGCRHSGAPSQGALSREAWLVVGERRASSPLLWE